MLSFGTLSVIVLQVLAALSIVVYFVAQQPRSVRSTFFAPGVGFSAYSRLRLLTIVDFDIVAGSDTLVVRLMPLLLILAPFIASGPGNPHEAQSRHLERRSRPTWRSSTVSPPTVDIQQFDSVYPLNVQGLRISENPGFR